MTNFKTVAEDRAFIRADISSTEAVSFRITKDDSNKGCLDASLTIGDYNLYVDCYDGDHTEMLEDVEVLFQFVKAFRKALKEACK